jgi:hypothetical protein
MKMFFMVLILIWGVAANAQKTVNEIISDAVAAQNNQKIGLGLRVLSEEDNKTVLLSKTGRYLIKGTVTDMWNGLQLRDSMSANYPKFPEMLPESDFVFAFGESENAEVMVYISYSCLQCDEVIRQVLSTDFLEKHYVKIVLLYNDQLDALVSSNVYCSKNPKEVLRKLYVDRVTSDINEKCVHSQPKMNVMLANAQFVRALPSTYVKNENKVYLGALPSSLF